MCIGKYTKAQNIQHMDTLLMLMYTTIWKLFTFCLTQERCINEMKLWCFRPLLCTLLKLNWAKQTPGITRRNYGARLRYRNECVHYSSRHIFRIVFCDKFQSGLSLHISYTPPIYVSEPALLEEIINQAIEGPSNSSIQPVTSFRPILRQQ